MSLSVSRLRRTLTFRRKKCPKPISEEDKPMEWKCDEELIRQGKTCKFKVKYLGKIQVYQARGVESCEAAISSLHKKRKFPLNIWHKKTRHSFLEVDGTSLKVYTVDSHNMLLDQTIDKVSFCAPDRSNNRGFAYICRDAATQQWNCHAFLAINESGSRLSHAVGIAFDICLVNKQNREKLNSLSVTDSSNFNRDSRLRHTTMVDRLNDPQAVKATLRDKTPVHKPKEIPSGKTSPIEFNSMEMVPFEGPSVSSSLSRNSDLTGSMRPRPSPNIAARQASLRHFPKLVETSMIGPFRQELILRPTIEGLIESEKSALNSSHSTVRSEDKILAIEHPTTNPLIDTTNLSLAIIDNPESEKLPVTTTDIEVDFDPFSAAPINRSTLLDWHKKNQPIQSSTPWFSVLTELQDSSDPNPSTVFTQPSSVQFNGAIHPAPNPIANQTPNTGFSGSGAVLTPPIMSLGQKNIGSNFYGPTIVDRSEVGQGTLNSTIAPFHQSQVFTEPVEGKSYSKPLIIEAKQSNPAEVNVSPFLGGPPIAAPSDDFDLSKSKALNSAQISPNAVNSNSFWNAHAIAKQNGTHSPPPVFSPVSSSLFLLPSERNPHLVSSDPFDTSWAEQATFAAKDQINATSVL